MHIGIEIVLPFMLYWRSEQYSIPVTTSFSGIVTPLFVPGLHFSPKKNYKTKGYE